MEDIGANEIIAFCQISIGAIALLLSLVFYLKAEAALRQVVLSSGLATREAQITAERFGASLSKTRAEAQEMRRRLHRFRENEWRSVAGQIENACGGAEEAHRGLAAAARTLLDASNFLNGLPDFGATNSARDNLRVVGGSVGEIAGVLESELPVLRENIRGAVELADSTMASTAKLLDTIDDDSIPAAVTALKKTEEALAQITVQLPGLTRIMTRWLLILAIALSASLILSGALILAFG